ncbi:hypothetical protein EGW08_004177 [Elysia chlorotica]|uniref:Peptidase M12B domain-containing protein n=1 Tax=Elysia chlorotica TaxID=188477 RepID=A0A3S0ZVV9_ELYCH|nr:hypothetical protein EGW08_004177 [Elysia chlorotica]
MRMSSPAAHPLGSAGHWLTIALCLVSAADGLMRTLMDHTEDLETVYINHVTSRHRDKRSANQSPNELHVTFTAQNQPIRLRLKRHAAHTSLPVYTLRQGQAVKKTLEDTPRISFYHDSNHGATFIYTRNRNSSRPFDLDGSMFINGLEYILTPNHLVTWVGGGGAAHSLRRLNSKLSFGHDGIDTRGILWYLLDMPELRPNIDPYTRLASQLRTAQRRDRRLREENKDVGHWGLSTHGFRQKRQASNPAVHYIELSMIADYAVWKRFLRFTSGNEEQAFKELQQYYLFMAVMMDVRYRSVKEVDPRLDIRITPVSLIVTDVQEEALWTEKYRVGRSFVQSINSLYALREWVRRGSGVPRADHTMLFSGYDLLGGRSDSSTIGVAFIGTACTHNSVSLIEEYFTGTSGTVSAHELGHSLDAEHDANYRSCSDLSANVMSTQAVFPKEPRLVSNPWKFSSCSVDAFGAFLET